MKRSLIPVLSLFLLAACCDCDSGRKTKENALQPDTSVHGFSSQLQLQFFQDAFNSQDPNDGEVVEYAMAKPCIDKYKVEMERQGFTNTDVLPGNSMTVSKRIMTQSVNFRGWEFGDWIHKILASAGSVKDVDFRIEFGIYDAAFIAKYVPDDAAQARPRLNRITVFVVPYISGTNKLLAALPPDEEVYNLGGLKP